MNKFWLSISAKHFYITWFPSILKPCLYEQAEHSNIGTNYGPSSWSIPSAYFGKSILLFYRIWTSRDEKKNHLYFTQWMLRFFYDFVIPESAAISLSWELPRCNMASWVEFNYWELQAAAVVIAFHESCLAVCNLNRDSENGYRKIIFLARHFDFQVPIRFSDNRIYDPVSLENFFHNAFQMTR